MFVSFQGAPCFFERFPLLSQRIKGFPQKKSLFIFVIFLAFFLALPFGAFFCPEILACTVAFFNRFQSP